MKFSIKRSFLGSTQINTNDTPTEDHSLYEQIGGKHTISIIADYVINLISVSFDSDSKHNLFDTLNKDNLSSLKTMLLTFLIKASGGSDIGIESQSERDATNDDSEKLLDISNSDLGSLKALCCAAMYHYQIKPNLINQMITNIETRQDF